MAKRSRKRSPKQPRRSTGRTSAGRKRPASVSKTTRSRKKKTPQGRPTGKKPTRKSGRKSTRATARRGQGSRKTPGDTNALTIGHQDGDVVCRLTAGGYHLADGLITISVETESSAEHPRLALFCLTRHPARAPLRPGDVFSAEGGMDRHDDEQRPTSYAYFEFHADKVTTRWTVQAVTGDAVDFELEATHDDVNYYDARAKRTPTRGRFRLSPRDASQLWVPV